MSTQIVGLDISITGTGCVKFSLNDEFKIESTSYMGFTSVKKNNATDPNIMLYESKGAPSFKHYIERNEWMKDRVLDFVGDSEYVAIEDYSFGSKGKSFHIGEFTGNIKKSLYFLGYKIRLYDVAVIKYFNADHGSADKIRMGDEFIKQDPPGFDNLKHPDLKNYASPKADVVDAYFICNLLHKELLVRKGVLELKSLKEKQIIAFNKVYGEGKKDSCNILAKPFICKNGEE